MKKFIITMFSSRGGTSHKRVLGAIGFLSLITFMFISKNQETTQLLVEAVEYVTIAYGLGTVAEKFVKKEKSTPTEDPEIID